jgi:hypothetical protein
MESAMIGETGSTAEWIDLDEADEDKTGSRAEWFDLDEADEDIELDDITSYTKQRPLLFRIGPPMVLVALVVFLTSNSTSPYFRALEASMALLMQLVGHWGFGCSRSGCGAESGIDDPLNLSPGSKTTLWEDGRVDEVLEIFSLGESLAWSRVSEIGNPEVGVPSTPVLEDSETGEALHNVSSDDNLAAAPSEGHSIIPLEMQEQTPAEPPGMPTVVTAPESLRTVSPEEIRVRRTLVHTQVQTLKEQGYAVLFAPPENMSGSSHPASAAAVPASLQAVLIGVGLAPAHAASVADHLTQRGIDAAKIRGMLPKQLTADLSVPELGLSLDELRRAVTGLWHLTGSTSFAATGFPGVSR